MTYGYRPDRRTVLAGMAAGLAAASVGRAVAASDVTLTIWDYQSDPTPAYLKRLSDFSAASGIKVERVAIGYDDYLTKVLQGAAANALPDILFSDNPWNSSLADQGLLADITDKVKAWGQFDTFYPGPAASATWQGKIYGVPNESNCLIMYYNKDMFDGAGLKPPTNWDEFNHAAKVLTNKDVFGFSTAMSRSENAVFVFESLLWEAGANLDSLDSPEALAAMTHLVDLVKNGWMSSECLNWNLRDGVTQLVNGRSAMAFQGTWDLNFVAQNMKANWDVALLPAGPAGQASNLGGENWSITSTTPHVDAAWQLISFVSEPKRLLPDLVSSGQLPPRKDLAEAPQFKKHPFDTAIAQLGVARARVYGPNYPEMANALMLAYQTAISGQATPKAALQTASATIKPLLAK
jgi:multiple sugar transport system substrate-binding protein